MLTDSNHIKVPLNLPEIEIVSQTIEQDSLIVNVQAVSKQARCPHCLMFSIHQLKDDRFRLVRDLRALEMTVFLRLRQRRFLCLNCRKRFIERFSFLAEKARLTKRLQTHLLKQSRSTSLLQTARTNCVSYRQTAYLCFSKGLQLSDLAQRQSLPKRIGVDEFALRKGHHYATAITDLDKAQICAVGEHRRQNTLTDLLGTAPKRLKKVREVTIDCWKPFHAAVKKVLPRANRVIDRFHIERYLTQAVDNCRKRLQKNDKQTGNRLKKHRKLFVTRRKHLNEEENAQRTQLLEQTPELKRAVRMVTALQYWYQTPKKQPVAKRRLQILTAILKLSNIEEMVKLSRLLETWQTEIANYFLSFASNGMAEGFNTKIKLIKRSSYGRLTFVHLQARIFLECFHPT